MKNLKSQHVVYLKLIQQYKKVRPFTLKVSIYACHHGKKFWGKAFDIEDTGDIWQHHMQKYIGYKFFVKIIHPDEEKQDI